jgi:hypothetical protein
MFWRQLGRPVSVFLLFWLASLYFAGVPLFADALAMQFGFADTWFETVRQVNFPDPYDVNPLTMARTAGFVLAFNSIFAVSAGLIRLRFPDPRGDAMANYYGQPLQSSYITIPLVGAWMALLLLLALSGLVFDAILSTTGFLAVMAACFSLAGVGVFYSLRDKRYVVTVLILIPVIGASILSSQRPHAIPALFCGLLALAARGACTFQGTSAPGKTRISRLMRVTVAGVAILFVLIAARVGAERAGRAVFQRPPFPVSRDESTDCLYYCFSDDGDYHRKGTSFSSSEALLLVGVRPSVIFGRYAVSMDVTRYLGLTRWNWPKGTLHPTLYGWVFVDAKWYGPLWAIPLGLLLSILEALSRRVLFYRIVIVAASAMFVVVGMRGSLQYAYSKFIYSLLLGGVWMLFSPPPKKSSLGKKSYCEKTSAVGAEALLTHCRAPK